MVSKLISILLSGLILIQSFQITTENILKLDELLEHAQFHKQEYGDSFFIFISKHYGKLKAEHNKDHHEEHGDHEQLPFQCQSQSSIVIAFLHLNSTSYFNDIETLNVTETNFHYLNLYSSLLEKELLQPPRAV